mgnify:CR=1 FL=1
MAIINHQAVHNPIPLKRTDVFVGSTTIAAKDTLRVAVPLHGATTTHFANATFAFDNANLSLTAKSNIDVVYVFITNHSNESITTMNSILSVVTHT